MTESEPTTAPQAPAAPPPAAPPPRPAAAPRRLGGRRGAVLLAPVVFGVHPSFNVYPLWAAGNYAGAQYASDRARRLGQLSLWIAGGLLLLFLIFYAIFLMVLISHGGDWGHHRRYMD